MAAQSADRIEEFRAQFAGQTLTPGDAEFDKARSVWNGAIDRKPAVIARCTTAAQVADAIRFARVAGLQIAVRGGGHSYAGNSVCDGGLMIHLGAMNGVGVDAGARRAVCGGGATWADVDAATQAHGLATPGGFISHTGIAGLTLGGGIGWLSAKAGLSCDNLVAAEVVTADSQIIRASGDENPDLFWALRGGGGNFGVVTSFEFALHPVGPLVNLGLFFYELDKGPDALRFARGFVKTLPDDATSFLAIGINAPPAPFVPEPFRFRLGHALLVVGYGSVEAHAALAAQVRNAVAPLFELVTPIPFVALQQLFNDSATWGSLAYEKALYLDELSDAAIAVIGEHAPKKISPHSFCPTFMLSGAYRAKDDADTAFGGSRSAGYVFNVEAAAHDQATYEADRMWVRNFWEAMRPHASGSGGYVNFMAEADEDRLRASYGEEKYQRLARIKAQFDPENIFRLNANIRPMAQAA
ncbi:FAD-binding oxidoreductase [Variovorax sp. J22R133]|uniref:FAD-binding oxidoreductase n=1 Tax=Variovorax brevis TaxID=3053503 RepID=UPI002576B08C|nr:FAD-binding oxidoreductase [Variovorax sp. J22R133]MDM0113255.1 FAD-binding oxidoreductase [Variovorax sp. J22R133]